MHNTFDIIHRAKEIEAVSHNFPEFSGHGATEVAAINDLNRQIQKYSDNKPLAFRHRIEDRVKRGLECECGEPLPGDVLAVYKGKGR